MTREWRLIGFILILSLHPVMMGWGCEEPCSAEPVLPNKKAGDSKGEKIPIAAGGYALVRFVCESSELTSATARGFAIEGGDGEGLIEPIVHVADLGTDRTSYVVLFKALADAPSGDATLESRILAKPIMGVCKGTGAELCEALADIDFTIGGPAAVAPDLISLSGELGGVRVQSHVAEGYEFAWVGHGFFSPDSEAKYTGKDDPQTAISPNGVDKESFVDYPSGDSLYRIVARKDVGGVYEINFSEESYKPLSVEIESNAPIRDMPDGTKRVTVGPGDDVVLTAKISGGFPDPVDGYEISWTNVNSGETTKSQVTVMDAMETATVGLTVSDSLEIEVTTAVTIEVQSMPPRNNTLSIAVNGQGRVTSDPAGINCGPTAEGPQACTHEFPEGSEVKLVGQGPDGAPTYSGGCTAGPGDPEEGKGLAVMDGDKNCLVQFPDNTGEPSVLCQFAPAAATRDTLVVVEATVLGFNPVSYEWQFTDADNEVTVGTSGYRPTALEWVPTQDRNQLTQISFSPPEPRLYHVKVQVTADDGMKFPGNCTISVQ